MLAGPLHKPESGSAPHAVVLVSMQPPPGCTDAHREVGACVAGGGGVGVGAQTCARVPARTWQVCVPGQILSDAHAMGLPGFAGLGLVVVVVAAGPAHSVNPFAQTPGLFSAWQTFCREKASRAHGPRPFVQPVQAAGRHT